MEGSAASGIEIDCRGGTIGRSDRQPDLPASTLEIRSAARGSAEGPLWDRPTDITIRNCTFLGPIRISGMGLNGQGEAVKQSSRAPGHTERAQEAAPSRVTIENSELRASGRIPLYLAPGVTGVTMRNTRVTGISPSVAVYMDAESAGNALLANMFDIKTGREVVALDGSAANRIIGNVFKIGWRSGINLYRNCGEGGTIRHQTPSGNVITGNVFTYGFPLHLPAINVGSREGWALYCHADAGYPFGSSIDNGDHAANNVVEDNRVE
ncbi:right-handed parallel beta-helix repeat-containing protein [uncultured Enterovirga sp.]|uniref:right-handed parallel beta-helix repeat-containing protein n=1 Tax=uncultured Enterovirga sp. TaxID=2026352 RepID=UPI0035CADF3B